MASQTVVKRSFKQKYQYGAGLDIHKHYITACVAVRRNNLVEKIIVQEFKQNPDGLLEMCRFLKKHLLSTIVKESTGIYTPPEYNFLFKYHGWNGQKPDFIVINPSDIRKYPGEIHKDNYDALRLVRLGLLGLAKKSFIPVSQLGELRRLTRDRRCQVIMSRNLKFWQTIKNALFGMFIPTWKGNAVVCAIITR